MALLPDRIETGRLVLRLWRLTDVAAMAEAITASIEHLRPWMPWIAAEPVSDSGRAELILSWHDAWEADGDAPYAVFHDATLVGACGLHHRLGPGALEIGYWIHVDQTRKGYATELAEGLTTAAFATPGIMRVEIHHDVANAASAGIPTALGYRRGPDLAAAPEAPAETGLRWTWLMTSDDWAAQR